MNFRYDINAMRALAVVGVILFHFNIYPVTGGFAGVDVFFVISGYLMTGIIFSKIEQDKFSLIGFYVARIRRIFPALIVLCFALMLLGFYIMGADIYEVMAKHIKYSLRFMSNARYLRESGYFDNVSQEKWLLHTWSLSVEWQFYILYPIVILALKRYISLKNVKLTLVILAVVSFALSIYYSYYDQSRAFYWLWPRAWEMLVGGMIYLFPIKVRDVYGKLLSLLGVAAILYAFFSISAADRWPGFHVLLPIAGSALILAANNDKLFIFRNFVCQFLGKISYSLYLWHWPIFALLYYLELSTNTFYIWSGIAGSFVLAALSYRLIEIPFSDRNNKNRLYFILIAFAVCYVTSVGIIRSKGIPQRVGDRIISYDVKDNRSRYQEDCLISEGVSKPWCTIDPNRPVDIIAIGDSHSDSIITSMSDGLNKNVKFITYAGCLTIPGLKRTDMYPEYNCADFSSWLMKEIEGLEKGIPLVMTNRLSGYVTSKGIKPKVYFDKVYDSDSQEFYDELTDKYLATICELTKNRPVYIVLPFPEMKVNVPKMAIKYNMLKITDREIYLPLDEYMQHHEYAFKLVEQAKEQCGAKVLDPTEYLCKDGKCQGLHNDIPVYYDDNHISEYGNKLLTPMFAKIWENQ